MATTTLMNKEITFFHAQKKIALLWFVFCGVIFLLLFLQTNLDKFEEHTNEIWNWILPNLVPTLSLILSVFIAEQNKKPYIKKYVSMFYYRLVYGVSLVYLSTIFLLIILNPLFEKTFLEMIKESVYYLMPFQGLIGLTLGYFFSSSK